MNSLFASLTPRKRSLILLVIIYIGFISLGLPDTVLGVAWDTMRLELDQPVYYAGFVTTLLTACSAVSAFFSGAILRKVGTPFGKRVLRSLCRRGAVFGLRPVQGRAGRERLCRGQDRRTVDIYRRKYLCGG